MKKLLLITTMITLVLSLWAQENAYDFLSMDELETLKKGEPLYAYNGPMGLAQYAPESSLKNGITRDLDEVEHQVVTEVLYYINHPVEIGNEADYLYLINQLLQVSKQKGIEYFSYRKQELTTLIEESYVQESANDRDRIEDPQFQTLPESYQFYGYQKDWVFSGNTYRYDVTTDEAGVLLEMTNYKPLRVFGIIKAFNAEELNIRFVMTPAGEGFYAYAIAYIEEVKPIVSNNVDIGSAFRKRIEAVLKWYMKQL